MIDIWQIAGVIVYSYLLMILPATFGLMLLAIFPWAPDSMMRFYEDYVVEPFNDVRSWPCWMRRTWLLTFPLSFPVWAMGLLLLGTLVWPIMLVNVIWLILSYFRGLWNA